MMALLTDLFANTRDPVRRCGAIELEKSAASNHPKVGTAFSVAHNLVTSTQSWTTQNPSRPEGHQLWSKTIKKVPFLTMAQSQGHLQPPNCSPEANHSHDRRSWFSSVAGSSEHGRDDCPLRVHTCGPFRDEDKFLKKHEKKQVSWAFFGHWRRLMKLFGEGKNKAIKK